LREFVKFKEGTRRSQRGLSPVIANISVAIHYFPPARQPKRILADFTPLIGELSEGLREFVKFKEGTRRSQRGLSPVIASVSVAIHKNTLSSKTPEWRYSQIVIFLEVEGPLVPKRL